MAVEQVTVTDLHTGKSATITGDRLARLSRNLVGQPGNAEDRYPAPSEDAFDGDFKAAADLRRIAEALIWAYPAKFGHLRSLHLEYLWKAKGGKSAGKATLGKCQKASGLVAHYSDATWIIWLAADHVRDLGLSRWQVEALVWHELCHAGQDADTLEPAPYAHDAEMFSSEIEHYGLWRADLRDVAPAFQQLGLFDVAADGEG